jgi:hypothetical protein
MITRRLKWLLIGFLALVVISWAMGQYDYVRLVAGKAPVFARLKWRPWDGGSVEYFGLGYTVTALHQREKASGNINGENSTISNRTVSFRVGQTVDYWIPFGGREHIKFIVITNK